MVKPVVLLMLVVLIALLSIVIIGDFPRFSPVGHPKNEQWEVIPELTDEFNGRTLDSTKWFDHNPKWKGRKPSFFSNKNVSVIDDKLRLTARMSKQKEMPDGYHTYTTAAVKSKVKVKYGYFEIKCKPMSSGVVSAFWFYDMTPKEWTEIDVFEIGGGVPGEEDQLHMNVHVFHSEEYKGSIEDHISDPVTWKAPFHFADGAHVYALDWGEREIKWYIDGELVRKIKNKHWHQPLYMNFDSEVMLKWMGKPKSRDLPSTYSIDYIRSWKKVD